jgi:hypothetical protein
MVEQDAPYDPYIPSGQQGGQGQQQGGGNSRTQALQAVSYFLVMRFFSMLPQLQSLLFGMCMATATLVFEDARLHRRGYLFHGLASYCELLECIEHTTSDCSVDCYSLHNGFNGRASSSTKRHRTSATTEPSPSNTSAYHPILNIIFATSLSH